MQELDWQLSSLAQVFTSFFPSIYMVEHLYIYGPHISITMARRHREHAMAGNFPPIYRCEESLRIQEFARCIAPALQELVGERVTEVLPALESLFLEDLQPSGPVQEAIGQFVAARQLLGHPVAVSRWKEMRYDS